MAPSQPLLTSPVSDAAIAVGKYRGLWLHGADARAPTLAPWAVLLCGRPTPRRTPGPSSRATRAWCCWGCCISRSVCFISSLTSNQTLAFLGDVVCNSSAAPGDDAGADRLPEAMMLLVYAAALTPRIADFAKGVIDTSHIVFFVSCSAWFVLLTIVHAAIAGGGHRRPLCRAGSGPACSARLRWRGADQLAHHGEHPGRHSRSATT